MKIKTEYFHCGDFLKQTLAHTIQEVESVVSGIHWIPHFTFNGSENQAGYNRAFQDAFLKYQWEPPKLRTEPRLIGDFRKCLVFVEIQFGDSSALYRDY